MTAASRRADVRRRSWLRLTAVAAIAAAALTLAGAISSPVAQENAAEAEEAEQAEPALPTETIEEIRERALNALQSGDLPTAANVLQELGDSGVPQGYAMLGEIKRDIGDHADAARWFEKAAEGGDLIAMLEGAELLSNPEFGLNESRRAFQLWRRAAERGSAKAQFRAGSALLAGSGTRKDVKGGADLLEQAARQCVGEAQLAYAEVLRAGNGREANGEEAFSWIISAERARDDWASAELDKLETLSREIPAYMSTEQVSAAYCRGLEIHGETCGNDGVLFKLETWLACKSDL